jgi:2-dehydropantoate 2-reductase
MHVLVYGAGAVGGYYGACLQAGGHAVTFVARGATLEALRRRGLTIERPDTERPDTPLVLPEVTVVDDPATADQADLVLVCVKSYDTPAAAAALRAVVGPDTIVVSLQNGVENEALLAAGLGVSPLLVAFTRIGVAVREPGVIAYSGRGEIYFGEPDGRESARAAAFSAALERAGIPHERRPDVLVRAWEKLAWNAGFNAVTTLTDTTVGEVLDRPATRRLVVAAMEEVDAVATALGIPVRRTRTAAVLDDSRRGLRDFATSMLQDRRRGRRLEWDALGGAVVRAAERAGVPVPVNRTLCALLAGLGVGPAATNEST